MHTRKLQTQEMTTLKILIADTPDPVFILDQYGVIVEINSVLDSLSTSLIGKQFEDVVQIVHASATAEKIIFDNTWYDLVKKAFRWEGSEYIKVVLKKSEIVPDLDHLQKMRDMIAVFLHRMRSPLTAMYGYAELMKSGNEDEELVFKHKLIRGFDQLFEIMEELEELHWLSVDEKEKTTDKSTSSETWDIFINNLLFNYNRATRNRIEVTGRAMTPVQSDQKTLTHILDILITNAIEHTAPSQAPVTIDVLNRESIKISHGGQPIPESIVKDLFYPFTTTKADNLGIGLTMAILYAKKIGGNIFLTDNSEENGISFTLCLPPA